MIARSWQDLLWFFGTAFAIGLGWALAHRIVRR